MFFQHPVQSLVTIVSILIVSCCLLTTVKAQSATATLSGTVEDQNGAIVVGANVMIVNTSTGLQRTATTNDQGGFVVPLLPPATYKVRVERDGFAPVEVPAVVLNVGDQKALQIQLKAGDVNAQVVVNSDAETVRTDGSVGTVVDRQFVANLPLNGRSFNTLLELTPGIVLTASSNDNPGQFSVNGQRTNANYFSVDGVGANIGVTSGNLVSLGQTGGGSLPPVSALGGTNTLVSIDAMQEFKVLTSSFAAEFGRSPGAQVSIVTRSGTNEFHGSLFDYFRNDALDANDWFVNSRGLRRAPLRQNDFGGTFSGPVLLPRFGERGSQPGYNGRNKTFFFFSYEGLRLRQPRTRITTVPTMAARQAAPNPAIRALLNGFPLPNGRVFSNNTAEFAASLAQPVTVNATSLRIDETINKRVQIFGRYSDAPSHNYKQGASDFYALSTNSTTLLNTRTLTAGVTLILSPKTINDLRVNWSRVRGATITAGDNFGGAVPPPDSLFFPPYASRENAITFPNFFGSPEGYILGLSVDNKQRQFNIVDNFTIVKSNHQLRFGMDYRRLNPTNGFRNYDFYYIFGSVARALTGSPLLVIFLTQDTASLRPQFTNLSLYAQDTWQSRPRISLTYGVRWDYNPPPTEKTKGFFGLTSLDNLSTLTLTPAGTPLWKATKNNFAPRLGISYQISQRQGRELTARGGVGIFYDLGNPGAAASLISFPYSRMRLLFNVPFPVDPALLVPIPFSLNPPFGSVSGMSDPNLKLPLTYQWNIAFEQSLGRMQSLTASYVGAAGRRLLITRTFLNPNPNFTSLSVTTNGGTSNYRAMQLQFQRRLSRGLQALASYTWARSIDTGSSDGFVLNLVTSRNLNQERGNSDFDIRHSFSAGVTYSIPTPETGSGMKWLFKGWWMDSMFRGRSAAPSPVGYSRTIEPFGSFSLRPDVVSGVPFYISDPSSPGGRRLNRAAFVIPTADRQGTLARNAVRGFPLSQLDVALRRQFTIGEKVGIQFRVEAFNVLNHPNFANPAGGLTDAKFGVSQSMFNQSLGGGSQEGSFNPLYQIGGPRSMQLALKITF